MKKVVYLVLALIIGIVIGYFIPKQFKQEESWKQLKTVDDQAFKASEDGFLTTSDIMTAMSTLDLTKANQLSDKLGEQVKTFSQLKESRKNLLNKLGY